MKLRELIGILDGAGIDTDAFTILDTIWLANELRARSPKDLQEKSGEGTPLLPPTGPTITDPTPTRGVQTPRNPEADNPVPGRRPDPERQPFVPDLPSLSLYPGGDPFGGRRRAAAVTTTGAFALFDSLAFLRALRPFRQRTASIQGHVIDEEATAQLTAELSVPGSATVFPVTIPVFERWFNVELIIEDDAAATLWRDTLREFAQAMRNSGAFRNVREWRLEIDRSGKALDRLRAAGGATIPAKALQGGARTLVLFASHGSSAHWSTGAYERLLSFWCERCAVALLHLLPSHKWGRTPLGEPFGRNSTSRPGATNRDLSFSPYWWLAIEASQRGVSLPIIELSPVALGEWAAMLMARGQGAPSILLNLAANTATPEEADQEETEAIVKRRIGAVLSASPRAFQLAVLLSSSPFTVPVARLIQESHFGRSDHQDLSELFMSGLLKLMPGQPSTADTPWFMIQETAAAVLKRSLTPADAESVSQGLIQRVSDLIAKTTGQRPATESRVLDSAGLELLPDWAKPFAMVASSLKRRPQPALKLGLPELIKEIPSRERGALARLARSNTRLDRTTAHGISWERLLDRSLTELDEGGERRFTQEARTMLVGIDFATPLLGCEILWVDDLPSNNLAGVNRFRQQGAQILEVLSTDEAMLSLGRRQFDVIISDMGRPEGDRAGFELLGQMRKKRISAPVIIFAGGFAQPRLNRQDVVRAGAYFCTNSLNALERHVHRLYRESGKPADELFDPPASSASSFLDQIKLPPLHPASISFSTARPDPGERVLLVGSLLIECELPATSELRPAVIEQLLLADLARTPPTNAEKPGDTKLMQFARTMSNLGWRVITATSEEQTLAPPDDFLHNLVVPTLRSTLGPIGVSGILSLLVAPGSGALKAGLARLFPVPLDPSADPSELQFGFLESNGDMLRFSTVCFQDLSSSLESVGTIEDGERSFTVDMAVFEIAIEDVQALRPLVEEKVRLYAERVLPLRGPDDLSFSGPVA